MTNDVEQIIIENIEKKELTYAENKAYMLYKEIWKFLLYVNTYEFDSIRINFSYRQESNNGYINKQPGITYTMIRKDCCEKPPKWHNYYEGCENLYIDILFNTNIDMRLFFKLISLDDFYFSTLDDDNPVLVCIGVKKEQIERKINEVLLKNHILKLEK